MHTHILEKSKTGTDIKESIWSAFSLVFSINFLLQRKADERVSHLLHTAQSDSASQIHNSPHTAFWGVAIETLLGSSGQKMRGDERGYFPLHLPLCLPATLFCHQSDCIIFYSLPPIRIHAHIKIRYTCVCVGWRLGENGATIRVNNGYFCTRTIHANWLNPQVQIIFHVSGSYLEHSEFSCFIASNQVLRNVCANTGTWYTWYIHKDIVVSGWLVIWKSEFPSSTKILFFAEAFKIVCNMSKMPEVWNFIVAVLNQLEVWTIWILHCVNLNTCVIQWLGWRAAELET